jgi:hypothetical protein
MLGLPLALASNKCTSRVHQEWKGVYSWRSAEASFAVECWIVLFPASLPCIAGASRVLSGLVGVPAQCSLAWQPGGREIDWWHRGDEGSLPAASERWHISCAEQGLLRADDWTCCGGCVGLRDKRGSRRRDWPRRSVGPYWTDVSNKPNVSKKSIRICTTLLV